jgi:hypothetical protein
LVNVALSLKLVGCGEAEWPNGSPGGWDPWRIGDELCMNYTERGYRRGV